MRPRFLTGFMKSNHTYFLERDKGALEYSIFPEYSFDYRSGVEERYLGRLITSRSWFNSSPRNKQT